MSETSPTPSMVPRVRMAAERTLLAWIRTGVAMMGFGFVVARFGWFMRELAAREQEPLHSTGWSLFIGVGLIALGVLVNAISGIEHLRFLRRHDLGLPYQPPAYSLGIVIAVLLAAMGVVMAGYVVALAAP